jgi:hypothetical protein
LRARSGEARPDRVRQRTVDADTFQPKTYRELKLAVACCRRDFGYYGPITLSTDKTPDAAGEVE